MQPQSNLPRSCRMKNFMKSNFENIFSKSKGNCHKKLCLATLKLLLLKSCYKECLSCVITILVVCISAPLVKNLHPTQFPLMVILSKNVPLSKQTDAILGYIFQFSIFINVPLSISYTSSHKIFISSGL